MGRDTVALGTPCQELAGLLWPNSTNLSSDQSVVYTKPFKIIDLYMLKKPKQTHIFLLLFQDGGASKGPPKFEMQRGESPGATSAPVACWGQEE